MEEKIIPLEEVFLVATPAVSHLLSPLHDPLAAAMALSPQVSCRWHLGLRGDDIGAAWLRHSEVGRILLVHQHFVSLFWEAEW